MRAFCFPNNPYAGAEMAKCGARTRSGRPCATSAMPNGRCRMHGGVTGGGAPKGNKNAAKHGLYSSALTDAEAELLGSVDVSDIESEIRLAKVKLDRVLRAQRSFDEGAKGPLVEESEEESEAGAKGKKVFKHPDYDSIIDRYLCRIGNLMMQRHQIIGQPIDPNRIAEQINEALQAMEQSDGTDYRPMDAA